MDYRDIDLDHVTDWIPAPDSPEKVNLYEYFKAHGPRVEKHTCICCGREFESHTDFPGLGRLKKYYCPHCLRKAEEYQNALKFDRSAWVRDEANRAFSRAFQYYRLPDSVKYASFENFQASSTNAPKLYSMDFVTDRKQVHLLAGGTGIGKTHLCISIIREFANRLAEADYVSPEGADIVYITESELVDRLKMEFQTKARPSLMDELSLVPLLVIDEYSRPKQTDFVQDRIQNLLLKRHDIENLKTVVAGNFVANDGTLTEAFGAALASRYSDRTKVNLLTMAGTDRRRK